MPKTFEVVTHDNFIDRELKSPPQKALYELIWNSCDADADNIEIIFRRNECDQVVTCIVKDDGIGIDYSLLERNFGFIGYSDKQYREKTDKGRIFHGSLGQGRYNAISVASYIEWQTVYQKDEKKYRYTIKISPEDKIHVTATDVVEISDTSSTGTIVKIEFLENKGKVFNDISLAIEEFVANFAPYLKSYPTINVSFDGNQIDVNDHIEEIREHEFNFRDINDDDKIAKLLIIKWKVNKNKSQLYFCDEIGTSIDIATAFQYKGIDAYLCSHFFKEPEITNVLKSFRMNEILNDLVDKATSKIKEYVVSLQDEEIIKEIEFIKEKRIYPYKQVPNTDIEKAEQSQFDILAVELNRIIPQLRHASQSVKKVTYSLLKETIKTVPDSFTEILDSVIALSEEQKNSLAKILKTTPLSAIIKTSQLLINRHNFLDALYLMVYDESVERGIKERTQFQKILLDNLWIFGDEYSYGSDDIAIRNMLKRYVTKLGREELIPDIPEDGAYNLDRIPDICLFRKYPIGENQFKNLVIEIKKPKKVLGKDEYDQIIDYYDAIVNSAAFPGITTKWQFILLGKDFNNYVKGRVNDHASTLGRGNVVKTDDAVVSILTWGELIQTNKAKLEYLTSSLEMQVGEESDIIQYLHDNYGKYLSD